MKMVLKVMLDSHLHEAFHIEAAGKGALPLIGCPQQGVQNMAHQGHL